MVPPPVTGRIPLLVIMGPTAVGKTAIAVDVARRLGGEIVSADSMQVYRDLDAGTAKPTAAEMSAVRHHLVDVVDPGERFSVARYKEMAEAAIEDIRGRGKLPLLVGGTGLYIRAVVEDMAVGAVPPDWGYRLRLRSMAATRGSEYLHARLRRLDPGAAGRIHPRDLKRVIRALEMFRATGHPRDRVEEDAGPSPYDALMVVLFLPRDQLYTRINARVEAMVGGGWEAEVRVLLARGLSRWLTASQALGYGVMADAIRGKLDMEAAVEAIKRQTRRFAKRQLTWFRREKGAHWVPAGGDAPPYIARLAAGKWPGSAKPS